MRTLGDLPTENGAEVTLCMEHEWPELDGLVSLEDLAVKYNADFLTLEIAARALLKRGLIERKTIVILLKFFFFIPYRTKIFVYRRTKNLPKA